MEELNKKRSQLLTKLCELGPFIRGSITQVCSTCNRAKCICPNTSTKRAYRLTYKDPQQKTKTLYIPKGRLGEVRRMLTNYKKMREISEQLIEINVEIFKATHKK